MGSRKGAYKPDFPEGTTVRIVSSEQLARFRETWHLNNPLKEKQMRFGGQVAVVRRVSYYHGGYEIYELKGVPGFWHECCLRALDEKDDDKNAEETRPGSS